MTDTISDLINRINNAKGAGKDHAIVPYSRFKYEVAKVLGKLGYLGDVQLKKDPDKIRVSIFGKKDFYRIIRISRPGLRVYTKSVLVPRVKSGYGAVIMSTPKGVLSGQDARRLRVGGEIICEVY